MAGLKKESLTWLDQIELLRAQPPSSSRADLQNALNVKNSHITNLLTLKGCFDPKAVEKARQAALGANSYTLSYNSALALASLKKGVADFPTAFHTALDFTLSHRLATKHIKALVKYMVSGKPVESFDPSQVKASRPPRYNVKTRKSNSRPDPRSKLTRLRNRLDEWLYSGILNAEEMEEYKRHRDRKQIRELQV